MMGERSSAPPATRRAPIVPWWSVVLMVIVFCPPMQRPFAFLSGEASPWNRDFVEVVAEGGPMRKFQLALLGLVGLGLLVFRRTGKPGQVAPNALGWLFGAFAGLALASVMWSGEPALTFRRIIAITMVVLAAFAYRKMSGDEALRLVFFTTLAGLLFGFSREALLGRFRPWDPTYRFTGTLPHPNLQGLNCALVVLSGLAMVHAARRWKLALALIGPFAFLLLTRSRTSLAALLGAAVFYALLALLRGRPLALAASLCLAATMTVSAVWIGQSTRLLDSAIRLGRTEASLSTFEGRTDIWQEARAYIRARPWLGYGYDSFWSPKRIEEISESLGWTVPNAHSDYLDVLLGLGGIGLAVFVSVLGTGIQRASSAAARSRNAYDLFTAALLAFCILHGILETTIVGPSFLTLLYMIAVTRLGFPDRAPARGSGPPERTT